MSDNLSAETGTAARPGRLILLAGLSLSIGWGIRGNYGHEWGAMMPGALAAMAAVLLSGRADWQRRVAYFAAFGALGWSFGGCMSYGQVLGYAHSSHSPTVLYGFASLFLIGFLWAAVGGAGTALPAFLSREQLTEYFAPVLAVFGSWVVWDALQGPVNRWLLEVQSRSMTAADAAFRHEEPLYWFDSDWTAALLAIVAVLVLAAVRRRWDRPSSLILYMALGWWAGFLLFPNLLGWRMTPPRSDNWAGCVGMVAGMYLFLQRSGLGGVTFASLVTAFIGGFGFAFAAMLELLEVRTGLQANWHSVLEQTYGFINGVGIGLAMWWLIPRAPRLSDDPPVRWWTEPTAVSYLLLGITYINLRKNVGDWVGAEAIPEAMYGIPTAMWFNLFYLILAVVVVSLLARHRRHPLELLSGSWLAKGQWLYLVFLWWVVVGNFMKALVAFAPGRLITEGVIAVNAAICTLLLLIWARADRQAPAEPLESYRPLNRRALSLGLLGAVLTILLEWGMARAVWNERVTGFRGEHIRFGPDATATRERPRAGQPHP